MEKRLNVSIIIIVGHSGSGKSTLAKSLGEYYKCDALSFSYAGPTLAILDGDTDDFRSLNDYIYSCISTSAKNKKLIIVDGVASDQLIRRLANDGFSLLTLFLDTPYKMRIQRMMKREGCSEIDAINLEHAKAAGKSKSGLPMAIQLADTKLDGSKEFSKVFEDAVTIIEEHLSGEHSVK